MREVVCTLASRIVLGYDGSFTMKLTTVLCETTAKLVTVVRTFSLQFRLLKIRGISDV